MSVRCALFSPSTCVSDVLFATKSFDNKGCYARTSRAQLGSQVSRRGPSGGSDGEDLQLWTQNGRLGRSSRAPGAGAEPQIKDAFEHRALTLYVESHVQYRAAHRPTGSAKVDRGRRLRSLLRRDPPESVSGVSCWKRRVFRKLSLNT